MVGVVVWSNGRVAVWSAVVWSCGRVVVRSSGDSVSDATYNVTCQLPLMGLFVVVDQPCD